MSTKRKIRLAGLAFWLMGNACMFMSWRDTLDQGRFSGKAAILGLFFLAFGLYVMIEAPPLPVKRTSVLGWILMIAGLGLGFLYAEWLMGGGAGAGP